MDLCYMLLANVTESCRYLELRLRRTPNAVLILTIDAIVVVVPLSKRTRRLHTKDCLRILS